MNIRKIPTSQYHYNKREYHLDDERDLCLEQGLGDHGWGALLKASAEKEEHFSLDIGVLIVESFRSLLLKSTKSGLWLVCVCVCTVQV